MMFDGIQIVKVPGGRFVTAIDPKQRLHRRANRPADTPRRAGPRKHQLPC